MKVVAFGASYSKESINKEFAAYAASKIPGAEVEVLDLTQYSLPLFTVDLEKEIGHPEIIKDFLSKIDSVDLIIISLAEHNGSYSAGFKNLFDWSSRVNIKFFESKKVLLLSTATGPRGGISALEAAKTRFPIHGAEIVGTFSLPSFNENYSKETGIIVDELREEFQKTLAGVGALEVSLN